MYFKDFNKIYYEFDINGQRELEVITDITRNVRFRKEFLLTLLSMMNMILWMAKLQR